MQKLLYYDNPIHALVSWNQFPCVGGMASGLKPPSHFLVGKIRKFPQYSLFSCSFLIFPEIFFLNLDFRWVGRPPRKALAMPLDDAINVQAYYGCK